MEYVNPILIFPLNYPSFTEAIKRHQVQQHEDKNISQYKECRMSGEEGEEKSRGGWRGMQRRESWEWERREGWE